METIEYKNRQYDLSEIYTYQGADLYVTDAEYDHECGMINRVFYKAHAIDEELNEYEIVWPVFEYRDYLKESDALDYFLEKYSDEELKEVKEKYDGRRWFDCVCDDFEETIDWSNEENYYIEKL